MACNKIATFCFACFLFFLPLLVAGTDFLPPIINPFTDEVCKKVDCGKGTCNPTTNSTFQFECQCDPGWKRSAFGLENGLNFLPCTVPNCSLNYTCSVAPAPFQDKSGGSNESMLDPCFWTDCGGGSCNRTSQFSYHCSCREGYYNLLNISSFPCLRECSIGQDCASLGIPIPNISIPPIPMVPNIVGNTPIPMVPNIVGNSPIPVVPNIVGNPPFPVVPNIIGNPPTPMASNNVDNANSIADGNIPWLVVLGTSLAVFQWTHQI